MRKHWMILLCWALGASLSNGQGVPAGLDSVQQRLSRTLAADFKNYPQEKVFLQASQGMYISGQTIWYQAYALAYGKPSQLSRIVYVRLSDANGKLVQQDKRPLNGSVAYGSIDLPASLHSGWYNLTAFTAWMLNFDKHGLWQQSVYIRNPREQISSAAANTGSRQYHVTFMPEGGALVDGAIANIAFKATDENGLPVTISGEVTDDQKNAVATITTVHDGMGSFELETYAGTRYLAKVRFPDGSVQLLQMPYAAKKGVNLRVVNAGDELQLRIVSTGQPTETRKVIVEAVQDNGLAISYPLEIDRGINVFGLKKSDFSTGILRLALFNDRGQTEAARAIFVDRHDGPDATLTADTLSFDHGGKNVFTLGLKDASGFPVRAGLSVSVTDARLSASLSNIGSYALVSAELEGYVYHPGYYFKNSSDSLARQLDLVMLTNTPAFFKWDHIFDAPHQDLAYAVEKNQVIAGKIEKYNPAGQLKIKMMIAAADSSKVMAYLQPDDNGAFSLSNGQVSGDADIFYEVVNAKGRKQNVNVLFYNRNTDSLSVPVDTLNKPRIDTSYIDGIATGQNALDMASGILLKQVDIKQVKISPVDAMIQRHVNHFSVTYAQTFDLADESTLPNQRVFDYLLGRINGLEMTQTTGGTLAFKYHGFSDLPGKGDSGVIHRPYFYIDEMPADMQEIGNMPMTDIAMIRFVPPGEAWFAPLNGGFIGAILIYLKNNEDDLKVINNSKPVRLDEYTVSGYSPAREFSLAASPLPAGQKRGISYPSTLYWDHDLTTGTDGRVTFHFPGTGKAKNYRVVVQGTDAQGHLVYVEKVF